MKKKILTAAVCAALLLAVLVPAGAAGTGEGGFYAIGSAQRVEIVPLSDSGEEVRAVAEDVDGSPGDETFYPGSSALQVTLNGTEAEKWYLLRVFSGDTILFADQRPGGGAVTFRVAFLLPRERTQLTLSVNSDADGFEPVAVSLAYTPAAAPAISPEPTPGPSTAPKPTPGPEDAISDCPRDGSCVMAAFSDLVPTAWYHDGVHYVLTAGLMQGGGNGLFAPNGTASRAMTAQILWNMAGRPGAEGGVAFADVAESAWYAAAVRWASEAGVITGWIDSATGRAFFSPDDDVTREQFAAMLYRYAKLCGRGPDGEWASGLDFPDAGEVAQWAYEPLCWWVAQGVINGMNGRLAPKSNATRAQVASMLFRYLQCV